MLDEEEESWLLDEDELLDEEDESWLLVDDELMFELLLTRTLSSWPVLFMSYSLCVPPVFRGVGEQYLDSKSLCKVKKGS